MKKQKGGCGMKDFFENGQLQMDGTTMDYIRFGAGEKHLIFLPGLGDGLHTVKGTALPMALMYHAYGKRYTVWMFSRKNDLPAGYTTRDMATDVKKAMVQLRIPRAHIVGVSMGGMIAQFLAADYPERVDRLVLTVTCPRPNALLRDAVITWMKQARWGKHRELMEDNLRRMYSEKYVRTARWTVPLLSAVTKPASYDRFLVQAQACMDHNAVSVLHEITAPTLVIGGEKDCALGADGSRELAQTIALAELYLYPNGTHALYEEERDFNRRVLDFLARPLV